MLPILSRAKVYKKHGMSRVMCGVDSDGFQHAEPNFAADMRELSEGVTMVIPDDRNGTVRSITLFFWCLLPSCDFLALQSIRPYFESPSAHQFCGDCDFDTRSPIASHPFSFLRTPHPPASGGSRGVKAPKASPPSFALRTLEMLQSQIAEARAARDTAKCLHSHGLKRTVFAWSADYIPGVNPCTAPRDALHLFPDGLLRSECAWLFYIFFKMGLSRDECNRAIRRYRHWPPDVRIPDLVAKLSEGRDGRPRSEATLRMTGSQVMHFSLHRSA